MRKLSVLAVFAAMMTVVACGPVEEHKMTRSGQEVNEALPTTGAKKGFAVDGAQISVDGQRPASLAAPGKVKQADMDTCSGWCTDNYCECTGSYDCCSAGCDFCMES